MTGWYPHVSGHRTLWHLLRPHEPSLFRYMKKADYNLKWYGTNHVYNEEYLKEIMGEDAFIDPLDYKMLVSGDFKKNSYSPEDPRYYSFLMEPEEGDSGKTDTEYIINKAISFLESEEAREKPFMLYLPALLPHAPYVVPEPYYSMYDPEDMPPLRPTGLDGKPSYHEHIRSYRGLDQVHDDTFAKIQAVYLGMISHVDWAFGQLMEALEKSGLADNTTVIVSSDHGDYAGDYGLVEKWPNGMEDVLTRVPLIIRSPENKAGHAVKEQVELFDVMATIMDLAGIEAEHDHFARSLAPQLAGAAGDPERAVFTVGGYNLREPQCFEGDPVRDAWFANNPESIYWPKARQQQEQPHSVCRTVMMRTMKYKLVFRTDELNELYDLEKDPRELNNLYGNPDYYEIQIKLVRRLLEWQINTSDVVPRDNDPGTFIMNGTFDETKPVYYT